MDKGRQIRDTVKATMEEMIYNIVLERPKDIPSYMIEWLQKKGGYTSNGIMTCYKSLGLTIDERNELLQLRADIKNYRDLDANNHENEHDDDNHSAQSQESDNDEVIEIDLHKNRMSLSNPRVGISAEVYGEFNIKKEFVPKVIPKSEDQINRIKVRIVQSFLFSNLDSRELQIVINAMEEKSFKAHEVVIKQGEPGDCLYVVDSGELNCNKKFSSDSEEKLVKIYSPGESFGELALLYNSPRAATVIANTQCILWRLDRETFNNIVKVSAQNKRNQYKSFLKSVEILSTLDDYELEQISDALRSATFNKDDYIIREGEIGDVFYVVEEGEAIATKTLEPGKPAVNVKNYKKGGYFGELALIRGEPRAANIIATSTLKLISLDRLSFKRLLGPLEGILKRNSEKYQKFISS